MYVKYFLSLTTIFCCFLAYNHLEIYIKLFIVHLVSKCVRYTFNHELAEDVGLLMIERVRYLSIFFITFFDLLLKYKWGEYL